MNSPETLVAELLEAAQLHDDGTYSWFGSRSAPLPARVRRELAPEAAREYLLTQVSSVLYQWFYATGGAVRAHESTWVLPSGDESFTAELRSANRSIGPWQSGWVVVQDRPHVLIERDGLRFRALPSQVRSANGAVIGAKVEARLPSEHLNMSPGFFMVLGDQDDTPMEAAGRVRYYFHLAPRSASMFLELVTSAMNGIGVPFRVKVLNHPEAYRRCDAGVLYVPRIHHERVLPSLLEVHRRLAPTIGPRVPAFTKLVRPGLGVAMDPGDGSSFGQHRCGIVARALVDAHASQVRGTNARLEAVRQAFRYARLDLNRPHLASDGVDLEWNQRGD
ncbi:T3SS effector HopA1 family protein [Arthrobacter sp. H16F315]|uniref:T3SS effector HopA1 family protein n=1 Tax=Arthrobacter sp. H16F315 TaxID=2955314 RepID=UPI00209850F7|nr:T3SS effector HopA1 family protein [Arthrobacter sp. H16F315]MDD1477914.1 T3SS effector HopA1 family protein [Arthrobacter sp. H16F315]